MSNGKHEPPPIRPAFGRDPNLTARIETVCTRALRLAISMSVASVKCHEEWGVGLNGRRFFSIMLLRFECLHEGANLRRRYSSSVLRPAREQVRCQVSNSLPIRHPTHIGTDPMPWCWVSPMGCACVEVQLRRTFCAMATVRPG